MHQIFQISRNDKGWKQWFDADAPEAAPIPDGYTNSLDTFRKLLLIRAWCPDRVLPQARKYISESMGTKYAEGVILDMEKMWEESTKRVPMICFLSMGSDPSNHIDLLAKKHKLCKRECELVVFLFVFLFQLVKLFQWVKDKRYMLEDYSSNARLRYGIIIMNELLEIVAYNW